MGANQRPEFNYALIPVALAFASLAGLIVACLLGYGVAGMEIKMGRFVVGALLCWASHLLQLRVDCELEKHVDPSTLSQSWRDARFLMNGLATVGLTLMVFSVPLSSPMTMTFLLMVVVASLSPQGMLLLLRERRLQRFLRGSSS